MNGDRTVAPLADSAFDPANSESRQVPGAITVTLSAEPGGRAVCDAAAPVGGFRPAVDVLLNSVASVCGPRAAKHIVELDRMPAFIVGLAARRP